MTSFDDIISGSLQKFILKSNEIGGDVKTQAALLLKCFEAERDFLKKVINTEKPNDKELQKMLSECSSNIQNVTNFKETSHPCPVLNNLSAVRESVGALGWVAALSEPMQHITCMIDSGKFFSNRILRDKNPEQNEWVKCLNDVWEHLLAYVKASYPKGLVWKSDSSFNTSTGAPPPPPPPAPIEFAKTTEPSTAALFNDLNQGDKVTSRLKKVTDDMKTHKNPDLKNVGNKPVSHPNVAPAIPRRPDQRKLPANDGVLKLNGNKWAVENFMDNKEIIVNIEENKQTVYVFKCNNSVIQVKGKCNSIVMDSCKKSAILFEDVISSFDIVNCQGVQIQVTGSMPTINIDKTDGCQIYLSEQSKEADIISAKSSELNVLVPNADGDFSEFAIPEQFKTKFSGSSFVTVCNDI